MPRAFEEKLPSLLQRLYRGMQRALPPLQLHVNVSRQADSPVWVSCAREGSPGSSADIRDVPGPCGAQQLHVLSPGHEQPNVSAPPYKAG